MRTPNHTITLLDASLANTLLDGFVDVLCDSVNNGASVGFLPPFPPEDAAAYWHEVFAGVARGSILLWAAHDEDSRVLGTVQLHPVGKPNGSHRAEVAKLLVHTTARRRGIARALMAALEDEARRLRRSTLVLDTRQGDLAEPLYQSLGYTVAGAIPKYALNGEGGVDATVFYYKLLGA
ncbi:MAG: GNAT family N-acetyltransferase [Caldilineaceae bacterium]|nr:GNAT family N-acetyltransferase [Caldilineaceae bacterium]